MAGGVLVEQRVEKQEAALRDRRGVRHQRDLAEAARALVGVEHLLQHILAALSLRLDDASRFKADRKAVDQRALIGERLGADDMAVDPARMRGGEDLFGRDVGIADDAVLRRGGAALPLVAVGEPDREISSRTGIVQGVKFPRVQPFRALAQRSVMRIPGRNRIVVVDAEAEKIASASLPTATSSSSPGKTRFAHDALG